MQSSCVLNLSPVLVRMFLRAFGKCHLREPSNHSWHVSTSDNTHVLGFHVRINIIGLQIRCS